MKFFKKFLPYLIAFLLTAGVAQATTILSVPQGGTGTNAIGSTLTGQGTHGTPLDVDQSFSFTWTGKHVFQNTVTFQPSSGRQVDFTPDDPTKSFFNIKSGDLLNSGTLNFYEPSSSFSVGIRAAALGMTGSYTLTLPTKDSTGTQALVSNGSGVLDWASFGTGTVTSVSGTANRITSTGGTTPVIDISGSYVGQSSITTLGTITTGVWSGTAIAATKGGTAQTTYTTGDTLYASASNTLSKLAIGSSGQVLTIAGGVPTWATPATAPVTSVSATDSTLTISPTTGAVLAGINLATANTWTGAPTVLKAGIAATSTDALILTNTTAATNGTQQWSPRERWHATGFATGGSTSQTHDYITQLETTQGTNSTAKLNTYYSFNGGAYQKAMTVNTTSGGDSSIWTYSGGTSYLQLSAASLDSQSNGFDINVSSGSLISTSAGSTYIKWGASWATDQRFRGGLNYFGGDVQSTAGIINIAAGTTSKAPILLTSGSLMTTPTAGAIEFLTDAYYETTTTNAVRRMIVAGNTGRATGQTAANTSVATYTLGAADASYEVSANVLVTTSSAENFTVTVSYTDEGNTARTLTLNFQTIAGVLGTAINFANGAVPYEGIPTHLRCKASTAITIKTTGTFTGATYNVEGIIKQEA